MLNDQQIRIYKEIEHEISRQVLLQEQGRFRHTPKDSTLPTTFKFGMLAEELGEVARCVLANAGLVQEKPSVDNLREELVQVAAIAVAWLESPELK